MTIQEILALIGIKLPDNKQKRITAKDVRDSFQLIGQKIDQINPNIIGVLNISSAKPEDTGKYELKEIGEYVNLIPTDDGLPIIADSGKFNYVFFDGTIFSKITNDISNIEPSQTTFVESEITIGKNIADPEKKQTGSYVNWDNGEIATNPSYDAFVKLSIEGDTDYYFPNLFHIAWYTLSGTYISGINVGGASTYLKSPLNAKFVSASFSSATVNIQIEKGTSATSYEPYVKNEKVEIPNLKISPLQTNFVKEATIYGKNRFDKNKVIIGKFVNAFSGNLDDNANYEASDYCYIGDLDKISLTSLIHIAFYNKDKVYISGREYGGDFINIPTGAVWTRVSLLNNGMKDFFQIEKGDYKTSYKEYSEPFSALIIEDLYLNENSDLDPEPGIKSQLITPSIMYWLEGKEMNIYFDSAIYHPIADENNYYSSAFSNRGKFLKSKYRVIPEANDPFNFIIRTENAKGQLKQKNTDVLVVPLSSGSGQTRKILTIGDSLPNEGTMLKGINDFFTTDPMNIEFIGTNQTNGIKHEAFGGAGFADFATAGRITFRFNVPSFTVVKGDIYSVNGSQFTVNEINTGYFTCERISGNSAPPASGTLTKVSGSGQSSINYASFVQNIPNKFWNSTTQKFDLGKYLTDTGQTMTDGDWVLIQLGINDLFGAGLLDNSMNVSARITLLKTYLASIISGIHQYNPNIRIGIGQTVPPAISQDATGNLNGSIYSLEYYIKKGLVPWWNEILNTYDNLDSRNNKIHFVPLASVIDRVNNFPLRIEDLDSHNSKQVEVQYNDVHPGTAAYLQMADAYIGIIKYFS